MIGLVLVTHGELASEFMTAMEHVIGKQKQMATISIGPHDDIEMRRKEIAQAIETVSGDNGVIILTDLFGGTPSNLAITLMKKGKIEVITGVNLPMLIKLGGIRAKMDLTEALKAAKEAGQKYINIASEILEQRGCKSD